MKQKRTTGIYFCNSNSNFRFNEAGAIFRSLSRIANQEKAFYILNHKTTIGGETVEFCKSIRNLGVIFEEHEGVKLQKVYEVLNRLRHTKDKILAI